MSATKVGAPAGVHVLANPIGSICDIACDCCFHLEKRELCPRGQSFEMSDEVPARGHQEGTAGKQRIERARGVYPKTSAVLDALCAAWCAPRINGVRVPRVAARPRLYESVQTHRRGRPRLPVSTPEVAIKES